MSLKKIFLAAVLITITAVAYIGYQVYTGVIQIENSSASILPDHTQIGELKETIKEIKLKREEINFPEDSREREKANQELMEKLSEKINLSALENTNAFEILKSKSLIKISLNSSSEMIKNKWNELADDQKNKAVDVLKVVENYLENDLYKDGLNRIESIQSDEQLAIEYFLYERISKDEIPPENLKLLIEEGKKIIGLK